MSADKSTKRHHKTLIKTGYHVLFNMVSVSYTHLDVYKRQVVRVGVLVLRLHRHHDRLTLFRTLLTSEPQTNFSSSYSLSRFTFLNHFLCYFHFISSFSTVSEQRKVIGGHGSERETKNVSMTGVLNKPLSRIL